MEQKQEHSENIKRLYRSKSNRMIFGVCGGLAEYLNIDAVLVRIAWLALTFFGGIGLLLYIVSLIIIPENPEHTSQSNEINPKSDRGLFWGSLLIIVGAAMLLKKLGLFYYFNLWNLPWQVVWAIFLILIGIFLLYHNPTWISKRDSLSEEEGNSQPPLKKQIFRSKTNRMLGGVCGGIAEYLDIDPTLVRLVYLLLSLASFGIGLLVYFIMMLVFPEMPEQNTTTSIERK